MPALATLLASLLAAAPATPPAALCAGARAPLARDVSGVSPVVRKTIEAYRRTWRVACDPGGERVDLGALLGDAEALIADVKLAPALRALAPASRPPGGAAAAPDEAGGEGSWPYPGIVARGGELALDWAAFAGAAERGTAEDARFWRAASVVTDARGEPSWLGGDPASHEVACVRLGAVEWLALVDALGEMESARAESYARHAERLRDDLETALVAVREGPAICGCVRGDATAGLDALSAAGAQRGSPERRALAKLAGEAAAAVRTGRTRVAWLQETPDAPRTGCAGLR